MKRATLILSAVIFATVAMPASGAKPPGPISGNIPLRVNEPKSRFDVPSRTVIVRPGTQKFSVYVPKSARGRHGVGLNGGYYRNVNGASVRPGFVSSLTVALRPGRYTVYDPFARNRAKGFYVKVVVTKNKGGNFSLGTECSEEVFPSFASTFAWVTDMSCKAAGDLKTEIELAELDPNFKWLPFSIKGFSCTTEPFARTGLTTTCVNGTQKAIFN